MLGHKLGAIEVVSSIETKESTDRICCFGLVLVIASLMSTDYPPHAMAVSGEDSGTAELWLLMHIKVHIVAIGQSN